MNELAKKPGQQPESCQLKANSLIELDEGHYRVLMRNPSFAQKHSPQFLKELGNVYRSNIHLTPFFRDIRTFADNLESPGIVLITKGENVTISADAACDTYDQALLEFLTQAGHKTLWLSVTSEGIAAKLSDLLCDYRPEQLTRCNYRLNEEAFRKLPDWRSLIPPRFSVAYYDTRSAEFLKRHRRSQECWFPESNRFAFVTLYKNKIVSECFSVFVEENLVEVGIETEKRFRRRGLAFLTSMAFIEHCLHNGLETNWGCWHYNHDSAGLAKKLGYILFDEGICVRITI